VQLEMIERVEEVELEERLEAAEWYHLKGQPSDGYCLRGMKKALVCVDRQHSLRIVDWQHRRHSPLDPTP